MMTQARRGERIKEGNYGDWVLFTVRSHAALRLSFAMLKILARKAFPSRTRF